MLLLLLLLLKKQYDNNTPSCGGNDEKRQKLAIWGKLTVRGIVLPEGSWAVCCRRSGHALRRRESLRSEIEDGGRRYGCVRQLLPFRRHGGREEEHQQYLPVRRAKWY